MEHNLLFIVISIVLFTILYFVIERVLFKIKIKKFQSLCPNAYNELEKHHKNYITLFKRILVSWGILFVGYNLCLSSIDSLKPIYTNMFAAVAVAFLQEAEVIDGNNYPKYIYIPIIVFVGQMGIGFSGQNFIDINNAYYVWGDKFMDNFGTPILTGMFVYGICAKFKEVSGIAKSATHEAIETKEVKENHREEC